jgi:branched-chain amino acid aminotransferase
LSGLTWVNGRFVPPGEACLEAGERGFLFGDGLFETVRLYGGRAPAWPRHAARLAEGCRTLGIPYPGAEIAAGLEAVLAALAGIAPASGHPAGAGRATGADGAGSLRLTVTRGAHPPGVRGLLPHRELRPTVVITANLGEPYPPDAYSSGLRAVTVSFPRNHLSPLVRLKSLNCLENVLGRREAVAAGADEGIFFNTRGELAEGTVSNVFLLFDGDRLVTPPAGSGLLPGIAREIVLAVGGALGLAVSEEAARRRDFENAREAWLTNSLLEVMPLVSLDGVPVGNGRPGEIACRVRQAYRDYVQRYFRQGFKAADNDANI